MVSLRGLGGTSISISINAIDNFSATFRKMQIGLKDFSKHALTFAAIGGGIAAGLGTAVKVSMDFDSAMTKSTAIMGDLTDVMKEDMRNAAREMAKTTSFSAVEAADSYFFLASAGLDAKSSIAALPTVSQFAQAGMFSMALATDLLTDAQSALGLTIKNDTIKNMKNMKKVSDVLVKGNTLANASVQQFAESLTSEAGAALKSFNKDIEEGIAVLASMADQGVKGQKAGTDLSRIMRLLSKSSLDNKDELNALGITIFDSTGKMRNFADIIGDMETAFKGMSDEQRVAALDAIGFTARVQGVILPLLGTSDAIREYEKELRNAGGTTEEVANKQLESFKEQVGLTKDALVDMGIEIGDVLTPMIRDYLLPTIKGLISFWQGLSPEMKKAIVLFAVITSAVFLLGAAVALFNMIASPWLLILLGIALAIAGIILVAKKLGINWEWLKEKGIILYNFLKDMFAPQIAYIKILFEAIAIAARWAWDNGLGYLWEKLKGFYDWVKNSFLWVLEKAVSLLSKLAKKRAEKGEAISAAGEQVLGSRQFGGFIPRTGLYRLHAGETVVPSSKTNGTVNIYIESVNGLDPEMVAESLNELLGDKR